MGFNHFFGDGHSQTCTLELSGIEGYEDVLQRLRVHAHSLILDQDHRLPVIRRKHHTDFLPGPGGFDGIRHQIGHGPLQPQPIHGHPNRFGREFAGDGNPGRLRPGLASGGGLFHDFPQVLLLGFDLNRLGKIQHIGDDRFHLEG